MKKVIFDTYTEAIRAARAAYADGFNTIIRKVEAEGFNTVYINEYFKRDTERFHD